MPARRDRDPGAICRGGRAARGAGAEAAAILRSLRSAAVADDADPGGLCRSAHRRVAEPKQCVELGDLYLRLQPDQKPVLLDPLRLCRWAANRVDGDGPAL